MTFKIVNTAHQTGLDFGEGLLEPMDAELQSGLWFSEDELIEKAGDADAVICAGPSQPWTRRVLESLSKCRILASLSIGYDRIDLETAARQCMAVTNIPDFCIEEVACQSMALIMALGRRLLHIDRVVREEQAHLSPPQREALARLAYPIFRMTEQTLGIIGLGKIGTALALKAKGVGLRVIAYDPYVFEGVMLSHGVEPVDLDTLLGTSDYISINAALNEETRDMIDRDALKKMKTTCYIVNTARGEIVDQPALVEALKAREIAGAGLDATVDEPLAPDNPLLEMSNVILTGHSGWYSTTSDSSSGYWQKAMVQVITALKGQWPFYAVNPLIKERWLERWGIKGISKYAE